MNLKFQINIEVKKEITAKYSYIKCRKNKNHFQMIMLMKMMKSLRMMRL